MKVVEATYEDVGHFIGMAREFAALAGEPLDRESVADHVEWMIEHDTAVALIAFDGNQPVGICGALVFPSPWCSEKLSATELWWFVKKEARGSGAGLALIDALESWARDAGAWRLSMMLIEGIAPGVEKIYERRGYKPRERTFVKEL